ncbi:MAG: PAS domain S-box protein, partial [Syntrophus sp. (in: bacteria)]
MSNHKIMIVEDEKIVSEDIRASIEKMGYSACAAASSGKEAIEKAGLIRPDLILMDIVLTGSMDGIEAATQIKDLYKIPVVYLTAFGGEDILQRAKVAEPYGYITKPFNERELHIAIEIALYKKQAEVRITKMEQWLVTILKSIGDAVVALDKEHRIIFMNAVAENLTGWSQEDALGKKIAEVLNIKDQDLSDLEKHLVEDVITEGLIINLIEDRLLIAKDGSEVPISDSVAPIKEDKGEALGSVLIFRDITKSKQTDEVLKKHQLLLAETEKIGNIGGWEFNIDTGKQTWTEQIYKIHEVDLTFDPTLGKGISFYTPASKPIMERAVQRAIDAGEPFDVELEIITAKGNLRSVHAIGKADLERRRVYGVFQDITDRKKSEEELRESEERFRTMFRGHDAIMLLIDQKT